MVDLKDKHVLIADHGLFVEFAPRLVRDFGAVSYFMPWASAYPKSAAAHVGAGLEGVRRVLNFWDAAAEADLIVFPDLYYADAQKVCVEMGKPVWGHRRAELLELDRWGMRQIQQQLGIPAPETVLVKGIEELRSLLRRTENKWVKTSCFRGDGETFHHKNWMITEVILDHLANRLGALKSEYEWIVEDNLDGIEIAYDGYEVHGKFPTATYFGFEVKDRGYIGQYTPYERLPQQITDVNRKIAPLLAEERSAGFCAFEVRVGKDRIGRMIDPCMRQGSPCTEAQLEAAENLGEILWAGAHGDLVEMQPAGQFIAQAMIHCQFALTNWVPIDIPPEIYKWVKLRNKAVINGKTYHVPTQGEMVEIGAVVAVGDSMELVIDLVKQRAELVQAHLMEITTDALDEAQEEIAEAKMYGIMF